MHTLFSFAVAILAGLGVLWLAGNLVLRKLAPPNSQ
jgi:hypothetical protein